MYVTLRFDMEWDELVQPIVEMTDEIHDACNNTCKYSGSLLCHHILVDMSPLIIRLVIYIPKFDIAAATFLSPLSHLSRAPTPLLYTSIPIYGMPQVLQ